MKRIMILSLVIFCGMIKGRNDVVDLQWFQWPIPTHIYLHRQVCPTPLKLSYLQCGIRNMPHEINRGRRVLYVFQCTICKDVNKTGIGILSINASNSNHKQQKCILIRQNVLGDKKFIFQKLMIIWKFHLLKSMKVPILRQIETSNRLKKSMHYPYNINHYVSHFPLMNNFQTQLNQFYSLQILISIHNKFSG